MKLVIKDASVKEEDIVTFELRPVASTMQLVVKKNQNSEQVVLTFFGNGTVQKHSIFSDIGFVLDSDKHIKTF